MAVFQYSFIHKNNQLAGHSLWTPYTKIILSFPSGPSLEKKSSTEPSLVSLGELLPYFKLTYWFSSTFFVILSLSDWVSQPAKWTANFVPFKLTAFKQHLSILVGGRPSAVSGEGNQDHQWGSQIPYLVSSNSAQTQTCKLCSVNPKPHQGRRLL